VRQITRLSDFLFGPPAVGALPRAADLALQRDRQSSELLVCLTQFGAIAFFGGFYAITPKAFPEDVPFEPVPFALALYTLFTLLRLALVLRDRLSSWFIGLSVVVDIAVLMVTIWSFHLQYQEPPTIYLKAPTLLYAFILIAIRVLRFEPLWILLAGASVLVGWAALVIYALAMTPEAQITHDFAVYASSGAMLIGAEVDKAVSFAAVTAVLALATVRARRLLVRAVTESHAAAEFSRFFAPEVASDIRMTQDNLKPGDGVLRDAAVMMIDLRGFTKLAARLAPDQTLALIAEYQGRVVPAIRAHGGSIDKYLGDGIMATFGAAKASGSFAADALQAQVAVLRAVSDWSADRAARGDATVDIGCAVATGPMLCGVIGVADRLEWTVIGEAANLAAKLEKHCKVAGVAALATQATLDLAQAQGMATVGWNRLPAQRVNGVENSLDLAAPPSDRLSRRR
jgi:adenylate cyclase